MRKILLAGALLVAAACYSPTAIDRVNHHIITRIKADTLVDQRNAWTLKSACIPSVANAPVVIGQDIPLVQGGVDSCPWANPTAKVHP